MFYPLALLSAFALVSSTAAATIFDIEVSTPQADLIFTPAITVSQVQAGQPNRILTNNLPFSMRRLGMLFDSISTPRTTA